MRVKSKGLEMTPMDTTTIVALLMFALQKEHFRYTGIIEP